MRMATMRKFEDGMAAIVARRLIEDQPELAADPQALQQKAKLVTLVAFAAMRHAWSCWGMGEAPSTLTDRLRESFGELKGLFASAAA
jgi:hypothetical protein